MARSWIQRADGSREEIPSKLATRLAKGDRLIVETAGGGGFGPPAERDPAALAEDRADGKVSPEAARRCYGWKGPG
jgi:N-methylhydantoinase B